MSAVIYFTTFATFASCALSLSECVMDEIAVSHGANLMQTRHSTKFHTAHEAQYAKRRYSIARSFVGGMPVASGVPCAGDTYRASPLETQWFANVGTWTGDDHCFFMSQSDADTWIQQNKDGNFDVQLFSATCRLGELPQFIEPLAGVLRDPRFGCYDRPTEQDLFSVDWIVFADSKALNMSGKARFYDAGGSQFNQALSFFLQTYKDHGIIFDEVFVWEISAQGNETYWAGVSDEMRQFWEPRVHFYDGIGVSADEDSEHNPVSRIFDSCAKEDFCSFKLDVDTPSVELPLVQQLLQKSQNEAKLDEFFFEHHVEGVMQQWWGPQVNGTFADSYQMFSSLRHLGVRAHSWV